MCYSLFTEGGDSVVVIPKNTPVDPSYNIDKSAIKKRHAKGTKYKVMFGFAIGCIALLFVAMVLGTFGSAINEATGGTVVNPSGAGLAISLLVGAIFFAGVPATVILFIVRGVKLNNATKKEIADIKNINRGKKIDLCNRILQENNLYILSEEEKKTF